MEAKDYWNTDRQPTCKCPQCGKQGKDPNTIHTSTPDAEVIGDHFHAPNQWVTEWRCECGARWQTKGNGLPCKTCGTDWIEAYGQPMIVVVM